MVRRHAFFRVSKWELLLSVLALGLMLAACSDETVGPPDDDEGDMSALSAHCEDRIYYVCAMDVLQGSPLTRAQRERLASCDARTTAVAESDTIEAARAAVRAECD